MYHQVPLHILLKAIWNKINTLLLIPSSDATKELVKNATLPFQKLPVDVQQATSWDWCWLQQEMGKSNQQKV